MKIQHGGLCGLYRICLLALLISGLQPTLSRNCIEAQIERRKQEGYISMHYLMKILWEHDTDNIVNAVAHI